MKRQPFTYSTRDLLMMAALAALGGVSSIYINAVGDVVQSVLGFAGTTQWAAGLHVVWLILAVGLTGKPAAGTMTGILKGAVELLMGNTHGLLVVLIDVVAGLLVDLGLLPFRVWRSDRHDSLVAYAVAGGLAAASNVFVFQLFASLPADILAFGGLLIVGLVAFASGVLFAGVLGYALLNALRRSGVVKDRAPQPIDRRAHLLSLIVVGVLAGGLFIYLRQTLRGPATVSIGGAVAAPFDFPGAEGDISLTTAEATLRDVPTRYQGYPLPDIVEQAGPDPEAELLLLRASDGYAFFLSMDELRRNGAILLVPKGQGDEAAYDLVGPESSKAWVRDVEEILVVGGARLPIDGAVEDPMPFNPTAWVTMMDSTPLEIGGHVQKVQGVPLGTVLDALGLPADADAQAVVLRGENGAEVTLVLSDVLQDPDIRIFTVIEGETVSFAVATMAGEVLLAPVSRITVD